MRHGITAFVLLAGTGLAVAGCAQGPGAPSQTSLLSAAGFTERPANTPQRQREIASLPPGQVVRTQHGGKFVYLYADPKACNCLYIGDQQDWSKYQSELIRLHVANEREQAAEMNQEAAMNWAWGPWGPGWWY